MSNSKNDKPSLTGQKLKTRKRDEREKYDSTAFRDVFFQGFLECGTDLEQITKWLDGSANKLDYRRYAEPLFDILFAGGILAPGGSILHDDDDSKVSRTELCVFKVGQDQLKSFYEVFYKLIRRYKYLEKPFGDSLKKILLFLKGFNDVERVNLAMITGIVLGNGLTTPSCLTSLFEDHLVKSGISLEFVTIMFRAWLKESGINGISSGLKKAQLDNRLMEFIPVTKQSPESFDKYYREAGLPEIADLQKSKRTTEIKNELKKHIDAMLSDEEPLKEIIQFVRDKIKKSEINEAEAVVLVWARLMNAVEWNKKEEVVADQALKHLKTNTALLAALCNTPSSELALMKKVQEYCYENQAFLKTFQKIILLFYKAEVLSEEVILKWYKDGHGSKGKSVFLDQMKKMVEWLQNAEEESSDGEDN